MKVLVTGGQGMVGRAMQATAPAGMDAHYASSRDGDLRDAGACAALFERVRPTHVLHLAARVGGVWENTRFVGEFFLDNIRINANVLEAARRAGVQKLVSLLSSCVYPDGIRLPLREADLHAGEPHPSNFGYAYAKRMLEVQSRAYARQYGVNYVCLIPNNLYGPHDNFDLESSHVIPAMIRKIHAARTQGATAVLWGDGAPLREFTFSHDLAAALWWALASYDGPPMNVGTDEEVSIRHAAETICAALDYDPAKLVWDRERPSGQHRKPTDTSRFRELFGRPLTPFADGVAATVRWYAESYPNVRGAR
jgi:GDP-L-fucose synthase